MLLLTFVTRQLGQGLWPVILMSSGHCVMRANGWEGSDARAKARVKVRVYLGLENALGGIVATQY